MYLRETFLRVFTYPFSLFSWLLYLFNPPPLETMSLRQKIGRVCLITVTLVVSCILFSMVMALGIFLVERSRAMLANTPELINGLAILLVSLGVNAVCVIILFQIRKTDRKLMPPQPATGELR